MEGRVTEYIYRPVADAATLRVHVLTPPTRAEQAVLDNDENWMRSGYEFKSGGYLPVCRFFYKPPNGGPSTHFYTAKADECQQLKATAGFYLRGHTVSRESAPAASSRAVRHRPRTLPGEDGADVAVLQSTHRPRRRTQSSLRTQRDHWILPIPRWTDEGIAFCVPE